MQFENYKMQGMEEEIIAFFDEEYDGLGQKI
jgi:uncharacterized protein YprB with RNaseH-like and TPR domain